MQRFEATHWFRTYALEIDEQAGTIRIITPKAERVWKIADLGSVYWYGRSTVVDHGSATDNILTGAAVGGKPGAFVAAMGPTGKRAYLNKLGFVVCRKTENQIAFGTPDFCYPDDKKEQVALPANRKLEAFVTEASEAANEVVRKANTQTATGRQ